jgi:hypothetical protein
MIDCFITLLSLLGIAWFVWIGPLLRRLREWQRKREEETPKPRYAVTTQQDHDEMLLDNLLHRTGTTPSTSSHQYPTVPTGTADTKAQNARYQQVREKVKAGFSGNQIASMLGGKRAATLELVRQAKTELGIGKRS